MNDLRFLISVTIPEFDALRGLGVIRIEPARIIVTRMSGDAGFGPEVDAQLLAKLPEFRPGEEHSVLVLAFDGWDTERHPAAEPLSSILSGRVEMAARHCAHVFPLTARARAILAGRLEGQIVLGEPVFEDLIEGYLNRLENLSSFAGAQSVMDAVVENAGEFSMSHLKATADQPEDSRSNLFRAILSFTRYKPRPNEPISGLADLGTVLKESGAGDTDVLSELGNWLRPRLETTRGFRKVYGDAGLSSILIRIIPGLNLPVPAASFAIFLHWRDLALRAGGVDLDAVAENCRELNGCVDGQMVAEALWLLGFSSGYVAVAPGCYRRMGAKHPFNPSGRPGKRVTLLSLPPVATAEPKLPVSGKKGGDITGKQTEPDPNKKESAESEEALGEDTEPSPEMAPCGGTDMSSDAPATSTKSKPDVAEIQPTSVDSDAASTVETVSVGGLPIEPTPPPSLDGANGEPEPPEPSAVNPKTAKKKTAKPKKPSKKTPEKPPAGTGSGDFKLDPR